MKIIEKFVSAILNIIGITAALFVAGALTYWSIELVIILPLELHELVEVAVASLFALWRIVVIIRGDRYERKAIRDSEDHAEDRDIEPEVRDSLQGSPSIDGEGVLSQ